MASKYMKIKRITLPMITVVLLVSQLTGCALFNQKEVEDTLSSNEQIDVVIPDKDNEQTSIGNVDIGNIEIGDPDSDIGLVEEDYTQYYEEIYVTGQTIGKGLSESAKFEAEKGTAQDYVTAGQIPSVEAYSEWRLAEHPLPTGQEEYDGNVFIEPTEPENGQPTETPEQHIEQKSAEQKPSTGSNTGSSGNQTPAQPSTPAPVEKPSGSNAEGIENGMITAGGLNRPAPSFTEITDEDIRQGLADGTSGTISDADLEESASHWAD